MRDLEPIKNGWLEDNKNNVIWAGLYRPYTHTQLDNDEDMKKKDNDIKRERVSAGISKSICIVW